MIHILDECSYAQSITSTIIGSLGFIIIRERGRKCVDKTPSIRDNSSNIALIGSLMYTISNQYANSNQNHQINTLFNLEDPTLKSDIFRSRPES